jgi:NhaC family Na+:H+ antiporter
MTAEQAQTGADVPLSRAMYLESALEGRENISLRAPKEIEAWTQRMRMAQQTRVQQPASLQAQLRGYQLEGLSWLCALPAVIMLVLPVCKVPVRIAMTLSSAVAFALSIFLQDLSLKETIMTCLTGYQPQDPTLAGILTGGGLISMLNVSGIIILSSTYSGIFEGTRMLENLQEKLLGWSKKITCCGTLAAVSVFIICVFCNQTIGIMMIQQLMGPVYDKLGRSRGELAVDIANTMVVMVGLCPWCIACAVPLSMLNMGVEALPYALFLWILPLWWIAVRLWQAKRKPVSC